MRKIIVTLSVVFIFAVGLINPSTVQAQFPRYRSPSGSPIPEQLNYFRRDYGLLDPYNTFIAPQQRLKQDLRTLNQRQQNLFREQAENAALRDAGAAPTGSASVFNNLSHYFPASNQPIRKK